jgi:hypothetical protein
MATNNTPEWISHRNDGDLYSVLNAARILCLNRPRDVARAALVAAGIDDPDSVLDTQASPAAVWSSLVNALIVSNENSRLESEELKAALDALTNYVGQLASEIEFRDAKEVLQKRIAALETAIRANVPAYRAWLKSSTIPNFDTDDDELVRQWALHSTKIGRELTKLKGVMANV